MTNKAQSIVEKFLEHLENLDLDSALELVSEDCVYRNMPFHTARGKQKISRDLSAMMARVTEFEVEMLHIASNDNTVLTERIDTISTGRISAEIELMGVFVVHEGLITEWRDYFDWSSSGGKFLKGALGGLLSVFK